KGYVYKASGVWYVRHHDNRVETASWSADKSQRGSGWSRTSTVKLKRAKKPSASWRRSTKARTSQPSFSLLCSFPSKSSSHSCVNRFGRPLRTDTKRVGAK